MGKGKCLTCGIDRETIEKYLPGRAIKEDEPLDEATLAALNQRVLMKLEKVLDQIIASGAFAAPPTCSCTNGE